MTDKNSSASNDLTQINSAIDFDLKMVRVMGLTYFIFGLVYFLEIKVFLVPLPIVFYMLPIAAVTMFVRSLIRLESFVLLFLPILILKDLWININPILMEPLLFLSILIWLGWGIFLIIVSKSKNLKYGNLAGVSQFLILTIVLPISEVWFIFAIALALILITIFVRSNLENNKISITIRIALLIQLIYVLYLLQMLSHWQNSAL